VIAISCDSRHAQQRSAEEQGFDSFESPDLGTPRDKQAYEAALERLS
jgi:hypothetical protein